MSKKKGQAITPELTDLRAIRSREALRAALLTLLAQKPLEEILVRDITTAARTGYATFYRHYATKDALLADLGRQQVLFLVETSLPVLDNQNFLAAFTVLFGHVNEHRAVWTTLLNGGAAHAIKQELLRVALAVALERVQGIDRAALELRVILIVTCLVEVLLWWLNQPNRMSVEEVAQILESTVIAPLVLHTQTEPPPRSAPRRLSAKKTR